MNCPSHSKNFTRAARIIFALLAGIFLTRTIHAQLTETNVDNRFLFIFDTSADMKKRVPAEQKALKELLAMSVRGELHSGDSVGVWTFDQELHVGQFPLQHWESADAVMIASNITKFIGKQKYSKETSFAALQPVLNQVAQNSERLTVFVFCDGESPMSGTPYDAGINQVFQQKQAAQKKARQPFIITLRAQLGEYIGCTLSFPPASINLPKFPPWPPPPAPKPTNAPPPAPAVVPSLIIIGKNVGTNLPPPEAEPTNLPPPAPAVIAPPELTNTAPAPPTNSVAPTNVIEQTNAVERTNAIVVPPENSVGGDNGLLMAGGIFFAAAIALGIFAWVRSRRKDSTSLISRSMNERK